MCWKYILAHNYIDFSYTANGRCSNHNILGIVIIISFYRHDRSKFEHEAING